MMWVVSITQCWCWCSEVTETNDEPNEDSSLRKRGSSFFKSHKSWRHLCCSTSHFQRIWPPVTLSTFDAHIDEHVGAGAMCTAFSTLALTSALQTWSRVIDSHRLHHFVRWGWNNLKCLSKMKWNRRPCNASRYFPHRETKCGWLFKMILKWLQINHNLLQRKKRASVGSALLTSILPHTPGQISIVTSILAQNNLLNSTTLTFYHFTARSAAHTF